MSDHVAQALGASADLVEDLATEVGALAVLLERPAAQNTEYEHLAALRRPQAEAVARVLGDAVSRAHRQQPREARLHRLIAKVTAVPLGVRAILLAGLLFHL